MKIANAEYYDDLENLVTTDEARVLNKNRKIDSSSSGLILADQTGIGKGRTVASIIRWAVLQGKVAIFITQRETLFTDMVRDLQDINFANHPIFVINTNIIKVDGKDISSNKNENKYKGEKIIFTTYFQIQGKPTWKHEILRKLSHGAILVLDEAHEAAASVNTQTETRGKREKVSNRYLFFSSIFQNISGVLFSSATYAKRPSNLMLYYPFTDINNYPYDKLLSMLAETGSIGQSLVSNALVESGQLLRRESSFKGILFNDYLTPDLIKKVHGDEKKKPRHPAGAQQVEPDRQRRGDRHGKQGSSPVLADEGDPRVGDRRLVAGHTRARSQQGSRQAHRPRWPHRQLVLHAVRSPAAGRARQRHGSVPRRDAKPELH